MIEGKDWAGVEDLLLEPNVALTRPLKRERHGSFFIPETAGNRMEFLVVCGPNPIDAGEDLIVKYPPGTILVTVSFPGTTVVLGGVTYLLVGLGNAVKGAFRRGSPSWKAIMEDYVVTTPEGAD